MKIFIQVNVIRQILIKNQNSRFLNGIKEDLTTVFVDKILFLMKSILLVASISNKREQCDCSCGRNRIRKDNATHSGKIYVMT